MEKTATLRQSSKSKTLTQTAPPQNQEEPLTLTQTIAMEFTPLAHEVIDMFESEYTKNLPDRKANALIKYCRQRQHTGFYYEEVQQLTKIINYAREDLLVGAVLEMANALQYILEVGVPVENPIEVGTMNNTTNGFSTPKLLYFNKVRSSDELRYLPLVPGFLDSLKPLLAYQKHANKNELSSNSEYISALETLRYSTILFLNRFAYQNIAQILKAEESFENKKNQGYEISPLQRLIQSGTKNLQALHACNLIDSMLDLLKHYQVEAEFLYPLIQTFSYMIMYRQLAEHLCCKMILRSVIEIVFICEDFRSYIVKLCFEIIWNAIEGIGVQAVSVFVDKYIIFQLKVLFKNIMNQGYKLEDKCLRNELLILLNYLLANPNSIPYFLDKKNQVTGEVQKYSFLENLVGCASIDEQTFYDTPIRQGDKKAEFGTNIEDLEFKKLIWSGVLTAIQSNNQEVITIIKQVDFIKYLLLYIDPMANSYAVNRWSAPQLREIQLHCMGILANIVLYMKDDFDQKKGLFCLTKFLSNTTDPERREKCLKAFNNASLFEEQYKLKIAEEGVMDHLIEFLQQGDDNNLDIKELCFSIIANLCKDCKKNKKLFRQKGGIQIVIANLKDSNVATSGRYALLALSILNCLWNAILGSRRSQSQFLDNEGLYVILQFLEECDNIHKKMGLSCLSYLIENQKAVKSFCDWNSGKTMINATQLLIRIYQKEDQRFGVKYDNGVISNRLRPLTPKFSPEQQQMNSSHTQLSIRNGGSKKEKTSIGLGEITEVGTEAYLLKKIREKISEYDLRSIVFSVLFRTGFNKNDLNAFQQQKIEVIQMYPHFKVGEIWCDIRQELKQESVKPTSDDEHWMSTCIQEFQEEMSNCINTQLLISREYNKIKEQDLSKFYQIIKNNKQVK